MGHLKPPFDWMAQIVGQIYEREDGNGFPLGLKGEEIREEAKILGIVDVLEACIHDRPYRNALTGYQLLEELIRKDTQGFSDPIVKALLKSFSLYLYNEYVLLNTKELARVVENQSGKFIPSPGPDPLRQQWSSVGGTQRNGLGPVLSPVYLPSDQLPRFTGRLAPRFVCVPSLGFCVCLGFGVRDFEFPLTASGLPAAVSGQLFLSIPWTSCLRSFLARSRRASSSNSTSSRPVAATSMDNRLRQPASCAVTVPACGTDDGGRVAPAGKL